MKSYEGKIKKGYINNSKITEKADQIIEKCNMKIDCMDENIQEKYFHLLDLVLDGAADIKYKEEKLDFAYPSVASLNDEVMGVFKIMRMRTADYIPKLAKLLVNFMKFGEENIEDFRILIEKRLYELYGLYVKKGMLKEEDTSEFYNYVLNYHYNTFKKYDRYFIVMDLKKRLSLTQKKINTINLGKKLVKMNQVLKENDLSVNKIELYEASKKIREQIILLLKKRKISNSLNDEDFSNLEYLLITGQMEHTKVKLLLSLESDKIAKEIVKKYEKLKLKQIDKINLSEKEARISNTEKIALGFNYNNFQIISQKHIDNNINELKCYFDEIIIEKIYDNIEIIDDVIFFLPLVNIIPEFNMQDFVNILANYKQVLTEMKKKRYIVIEKDVIFKRIDVLIELASGYVTSNDIVTSILGNKVIKTISKYKSKQYCNFYKKMLEKKECFVPSVSGTYKNFEFESIDYHNPNRLIMGIEALRNSCIDLGDASGGETYNECLTSKTGSVIIFTNNETGEFAGRMMAFRRGNVIMLAGIIGKNRKELVNKGLLDKIGKQIIDQSHEYNDNIDYVFYNSPFKTFDENDYPYYYTRNIRKYFPHADFTSKPLLIASKFYSVSVYFEKEIDVDFEIIERSFYKKQRKLVVTDASNEELTRIRACRIQYEKDLSIQKSLKHIFEPFDKSNYELVVSGEDWYIAKAKDGEIEEVMINSKDEIAKQEMDESKMLFGLEEVYKQYVLSRKIKAQLC